MPGQLLEQLEGRDQPAGVCSVSAPRCGWHRFLCWKMLLVKGKAKRDVLSFSCVKGTLKKDGSRITANSVPGSAGYLRTIANVF